MEKFLKTAYFFLLAGIVIFSGVFLQTMPETHAASQFMDYFQATPIIGSLSSSCWGAAAVGPRDQSNGLEDKTMTQYCYWDGGIIKGSDGLYHMFASRWAQSAGHNGWFGSVAVHATSSNLYGPYTDQGLCWPNNQNGKGHNVFPFVGGDGKYYIIVSDTRPGDIFQATSLNGPWTYLGSISTSGDFGQLANICILYRPDGRYMAVPRSGVIAISNNVLGPYVVQGTSSYVQAGVPSGNLEDPVVWYSGGKYHIVVNKWDTRKAYHITSTDGITGWTLTPGLAYDPTANFIRYTNGTVNHWNKLERPNVYMENGHVVAMLLAAIDVPKDQDLGNDSHGSKVIVVPFDGASLDSGSATPTPGPRPAFSQIEAESYNSQSGVQSEACGEGGQNIGYIENGDYAVYNNIDFAGGATGFEARVASNTSGGNIEIRLDSASGTLVGTCSVAGTGGWQTWVTRTCAVSGASGT
ncbi:MAG: carbohydrate-binding protein, partial [Firmicutes bacterium]|nr:carbohydrate-binding protein [Bacillota bacterium]